MISSKILSNDLFNLNNCSHTDEDNIYIKHSHTLSNGNIPSTSSSTKVVSKIRGIKLDFTKIKIKKTSSGLRNIYAEQNSDRLTNLLSSTDIDTQPSPRKDQPRSILKKRNSTIIIKRASTHNYSNIRNYTTRDTNKIVTFGQNEINMIETVYSKPKINDKENIDTTRTLCGCIVF